MSSIRYSVSALALVASFAAFAQSITLVDPGNIPLIGGSYLMHTGVYLAPPAGGSGQAYDFSSLVEAGTNTYHWLNPDQASDPSMFPNATLMLVNDGPDTIFYHSTTDGLERVGEIQLFSLLGTNYQVAAAYTDGILELKLPLTYENIWTDAISATFSVDGNAAIRSGTINGDADAYGTVLIPGAAAPIEILRVSTHVMESNIIGFATVTHKRDVVSYYPLWGKSPVLRTVADSITSSLGIPQNNSFTEWLDPAALGIATVDADAFGLNVRPNPASDATEIAFNGGRHGSMTMDVMDARGALVMHRAWSATGYLGRSQQLDVSQWDAGIYQVLLTAADGTRSARRFVVAH